MLVMSRRIRESFLIGDDIVITVAQIRGRRVHLIVNAPQNTPIGRLIAPGPTPGRDAGPPRRAKSSARRARTHTP